MRVLMVGAVVMVSFCLLFVVLLRFCIQLFGMCTPLGRHAMHDCVLPLYFQTVVFVFFCPRAQCTSHKRTTSPHSEAMLDHIADRMLADALTNPTTLHTWAPLLSQSGVLILQRYVELETALSVKLNARLEEALTEAASAMAGALTELTVVGGHVGELQAAHAALSQRVGVDSWHALVHAAGLQRRLVAWVRRRVVMLVDDHTSCVRQCVVVITSAQLDRYS